MSTTSRTTLDEYHRMIARGEFEPVEEHHVELIRGEILPMCAKGHSHNEVVVSLTEWSYDSLPRGAARVRVQDPIELPSLESEPEPDLVWAKPRRYWKQNPRPEDVLLLVEVADSSLAKDHGVKLELYAEAGIPEYWIVNIPKSSIEVYRNPRGRRYASRKIYTGAQEVHPLEFPDLALRVSELFEAEADD